jgi:hypothetical protein
VSIELRVTSVGSHGNIPPSYPQAAKRLGEDLKMPVRTTLIEFQPTVDEITRNPDLQAQLGIDHLIPANLDDETDLERAVQKSFHSDDKDEMSLNVLMSDGHDRMQLPVHKLSLKHGYHSVRFKSGRAPSGKLDEYAAIQAYNNQNPNEQIFTPKTSAFVVQDPTSIEEGAKKVGFPLMVKPDDGCNGRGVSQHNELDKLQTFLATGVEKNNDELLRDYSGKPFAGHLVQEHIDGRVYSLVGLQKGDTHKLKYIFSNSMSGGRTAEQIAQTHLPGLNKALTRRLKAGSLDVGPFAKDVIRKHPKNKAVRNAVNQSDLAARLYDRLVGFKYYWIDDAYRTTGAEDVIKHATQDPKQPAIYDDIYKSILALVADLSVSRPKISKQAFGFKRVRLDEIDLVKQVAERNPKTVTIIEPPFVSPEARRDPNGIVAMAVVRNENVQSIKARLAAMTPQQISAE